MKFFSLYGFSLCLIAALSGHFAQAHTDQEQSTPQEGSIGIVISVGDYGLIIFDVLYDSPAAAAGWLQRGLHLGY